MRKDQLRMLYTEVAVGILVFAVLVVLGLFTIVLSRENIFKKSYSYRIRFNQVIGLISGDNVMLRGVKVGVVKSMDVHPDGVYVLTSLEYPAKFHENYEIQIQPSSVLGGHYLDVNEGNESAPLVPPGTLLIGKEPVELIREATETVSMIKESLSDGGVLNNLQSAMSNVNIIVSQVSHGKGTIGKLVMEDRLFTDIQNLSSNISVVTERLVKGEGTLGKLSKDDALYEDLRRLVQEGRSTLDDLRETSPIVSFGSMFLGAF